MPEVELPDGRVLEFPDDATPDEIEAALNGGPSQSATPAAKGWLETIADAAIATGPQRIFQRENLPTTLGAVGAALTGGLGLIPAAAGAALGGSTGAALNAARDGRLPTRREIALEGGVQGVGTLAGGAAARGVAKVGEMAGRKLMGSALKIDRGYLKKMAQAEPGETLVGKEDRLIAKALDADGNVLRHSGTNRLQDALDRVSDQRATAISLAPQAPVKGSGRQIESGVVASAADETGLAPQDNLDEIARVVRQIRDNPRVNTNASGLVTPGGAPPLGVRDLTPRELADVIEGTNRNLQGLFGDTSAAASARAKALKGGVAAAREALETAVPESRTLGREMRDLIDLRNVSQLAQARANNQNLVGLTDVISLSAGRPAVLAASVAQRPVIAAALGRGAWRAGKGAGRTRSRLLAQLLGARAAGAGSEREPE